MKREATVDPPPFVAFVDRAKDGWQDRARQCLADGQNFFVPLCDGSGSEAALAEILEIEFDPFPAPETTAQLLSSSHFMVQQNFRLPYKKGDSPERIYDVEQFGLPRMHPPNVKQYLVYCHVRGIVSQHDLPFDARVARDHYNNDRFGRSHFPEAAIFRWETRSGGERSSWLF
ncbi:MAG TPA: hypothetical protein VK530_06030 [Candidatus Acidoferrum sp.]|nr:hypothetical protein [Candidatus Acidoferrum sp.]